LPMLHSGNGGNHWFLFLNITVFLHDLYQLFCYFFIIYRAGWFVMLLKKVTYQWTVCFIVGLYPQPAKAHQKVRGIIPSLKIHFMFLLSTW
jgi:hypothetical protein